MSDRLPPTRRGALLLLALVATGSLLAACGGGSSAGTATTAGTASTVKPTRTYAGPAGLSGGGQPQPDGFMWLLARMGGAADIQQLNLTTGSIGQIIPVTAGANSISQSPSGVIGVGVATALTGALELRNGASGALVATVPIGAPVKDVYAGADGTTFYVLNGTTSSASVTLVNSGTDRASVSVPVPLDTVAVAVDPSGQNLFAVGSGGKVDQITIGSGAVTASYPVGHDPIAVAVSTSGSTLYVLNTVGAGANVGVIDVATEAQTKVLPAPADSVAVQVSPDGGSLYVVVGTPTVGNVQVYAIAP